MLRELSDIIAQYIAQKTSRELRSVTARNPADGGTDIARIPRELRSVTARNPADGGADIARISREARSGIT